MNVKTFPCHENQKLHIHAGFKDLGHENICINRIVCTIRSHIESEVFFLHRRGVSCAAKRSKRLLAMAAGE